MKKLNFSLTKATKAFSTVLLPILFFASCNSGSNSDLNPRNPYGAGPLAPSLAANGSPFTDPADLSSAGAYAVLSKSGISNTGVTAITGHIASSPIAATAITGFALTMDASNQFSVANPRSQVTGNVYGATYAEPTPTNLTTAINTMERAYITAAGRTPPDFTETGAGNIGGMTLTPGLYKWGTDVIIPTAVTLSGGANDVWIFQVAGFVNISSGVAITLSGGAQAKNIYWQIGNGLTIQTTATFVGTVMSNTSVTMNTGSTLLGRAFAHTAVVLNAATITP